MKLELEDLSVAVRLVIVGIVMFSIAYPLTVFLGGQLWRGNAQGSLVKYKGEDVGSKLIGQDFDDPRFFHSRPSSIDYNAMESGSSNLAPQIWVLFSIEPDDIEDDLNKGIIPEKLESKFENVGRPLPEGAEVVIEKENVWVIRDEKELYKIQKGGGKLDVYPKSELKRRVENILQKISRNRENKNLSVPSDLVTESGSALDPHITENSAMLQAPRIAKNTDIPENELRDLVKRHTKGPLLGIYGRKRVNVLLLNIEIMRRMEEV